jgi:hypothetical protein
MMPNAASEDVPYYHHAPTSASPGVPPVAQPVTAAPAKKRTAGCLPVALFVIGLLLAAPSLSKLTSHPQNTGGSFNYAPLPTDIYTPTPTDTPTPPTWKTSASARFGPSYGNEYASPGNYFEWVDYKFENQSSETQGFQASDFSLCDTSGTCWNMYSASPRGPFSVPAGYQQNVEVAWIIPCGVTQFRTSFQPEGNPNTYWDWHNSFTSCP